MRIKEAILGQFVSIQRHLMVKQDISKQEAYIQSLALVAEVLIDIRTNLASINQKLETKTSESPDELQTMRKVN